MATGTCSLLERVGNYVTRDASKVLPFLSLSVKQR